jgi:hypothetical protein
MVQPRISLGEYLRHPLWPAEISIETRTELRDIWVELKQQVRHVAAARTKAFFAYAWALPLLLLASLGVIHGDPYPVGPQLAFFVLAGCLLLWLGQRNSEVLLAGQAAGLELYKRAQALQPLLMELPWGLQALAVYPEVHFDSRAAFEVSALEMMEDHVWLDGVGLLEPDQLIEHNDAGNPDLSLLELLEWEALAEDKESVGTRVNAALHRFPLADISDDLLSWSLPAFRLIGGALVALGVLVWLTHDHSLIYSRFSWNPTAWSFAALVALHLCSYLVLLIHCIFKSYFAPPYSGSTSRDRLANLVGNSLGLFMALLLLLPLLHMVLAPLLKTGTN